MTMKERREAEPTGVELEARSYRYQQIANRIRARVLSGEFGPGVLLPSEATLARAYGVSRLTVQRGLDMLRQEGLIEARRGFGWFVPGPVLKHSLPELGTIEQQIAKSGAQPVRRVLEFAFVPADEHVRRILGCEHVLRTVRLNLANDEPVARVTTWCCEEVGARFSKADVENHSLYELLPYRIGHATQVIRAVAATREDAALLKVPPGSPCLSSERTTYSVEGQAILHAVAVFAGHLTEYVVQLTGGGGAPEAELRLTATTLTLG
ncbi:MAG TPA: GntR family transcriptional regulator [Candidatus Dormibacteraeota bacterium]|jgi:GntR family transcriptional regulator|nr:GntR family transcriptional regulator [Candidatus Dormibacteraeota bacterium]